MEDRGHILQRHHVLLCPEKPLQHVLLLRHPCFLLPPPQHQCQHQDFLLKQLPLLPDGNPPGHVEVLGPAPVEGFRRPVTGQRMEGVDSRAATQGGQGLTPGENWSNIW